MASTKKPTSAKNSTNKSTRTRATNKSVETTTFNGEVRSAKEREAKLEIGLWVTLAVCILLFISNLGFGGKVGGAISGVLFGVFGLIFYIFPIVALVLIFFFFANRGNKIALVKLISAIVLVLQAPILLELFRNGSNPAGAVGCFFSSMENKNGGGFIGGLLSKLLVEGFGVAGGYVISILLAIISIILITERTLLRRSRSRRRPAPEPSYRSDADVIAERNERVRRIEEDRLQQQEAYSKKDGARRDRKFSGVAFDTQVAANSKAQAFESDELSEVKLPESMDSTSVNRVSISSKLKGSRSNIHIDTPPAPSTQEEYEQLPAHESKPAPAVEAKSKSTPRPNVTVAKATVEKAQNPSTPAQAQVKSGKNYVFPPLSLLKKKKSSSNVNSKATLEATADKLEQTLKNFGINVTVTDVTCGPAVTRYELLPEVGVRVNRITNLADDIKLNLAVTDIRIEAPIPGKAAVGIEVPNREKIMVSFEELISSKEFDASTSKVTFAAGRDIAGNVITANIAKMPHLLIAGTTGSGKSVCINTIIMSILYKASPEDVKLIMIDPKVVELSIYNGIPHLFTPVVTDPKKAAGALHWAVTEMDDRYLRFANAGVRDLKSYNEKLVANNYQMPINSRGEMGTFEKMPEMVVIVDELADLMMVAAKEVEESICRLAQKARAAGIYLILATQRPSVDVVTGLIKANMPSRIAFAVKSGIDSRTIIDMYGAEKLLGNGDMLYYPQGLTQPLRVQGAFVSDDEVSAVVEFIKEQNGEAAYDGNIAKAMENAQEMSSSTAIGGASTIDDSLDPLFAEAGRLACDKEKLSIGMMQRALKLGFNRAARIMDQLEEAGVVGPDVGTKPRDVIMSRAQLEQMLNPSSAEYPIDEDLD